MTIKDRRPLSLDKVCKAAYSTSVSVGSKTIGAELFANWLLPEEVTKSRRIGPALTEFETRFPNEVSLHCKESTSGADHPVFIFSAGWGSGSTLLQRLLVSSGEILVWGEPMDEAAPIQRMATSVCAVRKQWPRLDHFQQVDNSNSLSGSWIANLAPDMSYYKSAYRDFIYQWLCAPANHAGYKKWGMKEVRLTINHAKFLQWMYPDAKFLFVYRDLYDSYLSVRRKPWLSIWPDHSATPIMSFAHHWKILLEGFLDGYSDVGGVLIKYEDLVSGQLDLQMVADYSGLERIDESILNVKVGSRSKNRRPLILPEKIILDSIAGSLRKRLGYWT